MSDGLRPLTLRSRLVLLFIAGSTAVLIGAAGFLYVAIDRSLVGAIDEGLRARATDLEAVLREDDSSFPTQDPYAQVLSPSGELMMRSPATSSADPVLTPAQAESLPSGSTIEREVGDLGGDTRLLVRRVTAGSRPAVLVVGAPLDQYRHTRQRLLLVMLAGGPILLVVMASAGWLLAGAALRPVRRMAEEADEISIADLSRRLEVPAAEDEIAHLARTLNAMLGRVEHSVAHERRFIDDASHELRTPLTILRGELELALTQANDPEEVLAAVRSSLDEAERLSRLSDDLLVMARARAGELRLRSTAVDVTSAAAKVCDVLRVASNVVLDCEGEKATILGDPDRIDQILMNLIVNAQRFARSRVLVQVRPAEAPGPRPSSLGVELIVADDGDGFAASLLPITFERFRRSDPSRARDTGGTGLGLAIAAELVRAHGGSISAGNDSALGGAWVRVWLPRRERELAREGDARRDRVGAGDGDDDQDGVGEGATDRVAGRGRHEV